MRKYLEERYLNLVEANLVELAAAARRQARHQLEVDSEHLANLNGGVCSSHGSYSEVLVELSLRVRRRVLLHRDTGNESERGHCLWLKYCQCHWQCQWLLVT